MITRVGAGIIVTVFGGLILAATVWNFSAVASIDKRFVHKEDMVTFMKSNEEQHAYIRDKLDDIHDKMFELHVEGE
jgi:hypothetical protein